MEQLALARGLASLEVQQILGSCYTLISPITGDVLRLLGEERSGSKSIKWAIETGNREALWGIGVVIAVDEVELRGRSQLSKVLRRWRWGDVEGGGNSVGYSWRRRRGVFVTSLRLGR
ncbi:hypothetical protein Nepgr_016757 [Nepenthes gracilis]|uniref:Uncharacterized protein n=1 Tax=Nepenthes gracilis TaxID=150966 RepID=A0AAD3SR84_NEPGR|nr:hypothetical protein Nepgr_016757 [Nepenthes gracilis]